VIQQIGVSLWTPLHRAAQLPFGFSGGFFGKFFRWRIEVDLHLSSVALLLSRWFWHSIFRLWCWVEVMVLLMIIRMIIFWHQVWNLLWRFSVAVILDDYLRWRPTTTACPHPYRCVVVVAFLLDFLK
jgi:hypothetical protein